MKSILIAMTLMSGTANAALSAFPSFVSFYNVSTSGPGQSQSVTIQNSGPETATPLVSNGCFGDFQVSSFCYSIPVNGSCSIRISFAPRMAGYQSCSIFVNDGANGSVSINVNGHAVK